jgi:hypothetical protein
MGSRGRSLHFSLPVVLVRIQGHITNCSYPSGYRILAKIYKKKVSALFFEPLNTHSARFAFSINTFDYPHTLLTQNGINFQLANPNLPRSKFLQFSTKEANGPRKSLDCSVPLRISSVSVSGLSLMATPMSSPTTRKARTPRSTRRLSMLRSSLPLPSTPATSMLNELPKPRS